MEANVLCDGIPPMQTTTGCWVKPSGLINHISVGPSGVYGINHNNRYFYAPNTYANQAVGKYFILAGDDG